MADRPCRTHGTIACTPCTDAQCPEHSGPVRCILFAGHEPDGESEHNYGGLSPRSVWMLGWVENDSAPVAEPTCCGGRCTSAAKRERAAWTLDIAAMLRSRGEYSAADFLVPSGANPVGMFGPKSNTGPEPVGSDRAVWAREAADALRDMASSYNHQPAVYEAGLRAAADWLDPPTLPDGVEIIGYAPEPERPAIIDWNERTHEWLLTCPDHGLLASRSGHPLTAGRVGHDDLVYLHAEHAQQHHGGDGTVQVDMLILPPRPAGHATSGADRPE